MLGSATFAATFLGPFITSLLTVFQWCASAVSGRVANVMFWLACFRGSKGATSHSANDHFLPRLSSDLGGVLLFRIHCQEAAVLRLSRLGCVTFFVYVLGLFSSPLGAPKVPLRTPANDHFLPRLSSDLGGVLLFRIHRLGCASCFFVYVLGLFSSPLGAPKVPLRTPANDHFLPRLSSDLGGVLLFRIHCQEAAVLRLSRLGCVTFFVYVLGLFSSPLGAPKVPLRTPANDHFLPPLSSDLGGVLLFRIHCQEAAVLRLSRPGCDTYWGSFLLL